MSSQSLGGDLTLAQVCTLDRAVSKSYGPVVAADCTAVYTEFISGTVESTTSTGRYTIGSEFTYATVDVTAGADKLPGLQVGDAVCTATMVPSSLSTAEPAGPATTTATSVPAASSGSGANTGAKAGGAVGGLAAVAAAALLV